MKKLILMIMLLMGSSLALAVDGLSTQISTAASAAITNAVNNAAKNINAAIQSYLEGKANTANTTAGNALLNSGTPAQPIRPLDKPAVGEQNAQTQTEDYLTSLIKKALSQ